MSRAENRHHRQRVIKNRVRNLKAKWSWSSNLEGEKEWLLKTACGKDNPFTRCSCEMCSNSNTERAENKRERKLAKHRIKKEED
jgi:hypothetical protein